MRTRRLVTCVTMVTALVVLLISPSALSMTFTQSPLLEQMVENGLIPPVEDRIPNEPLVVDPLHEIGHYGGTARVFNAEAPTRPYTAQMLMGSHGPFRTSPEGKPGVPNVLRSYEANEDFTVWTFHLREGVRWSDGAPLTAENFLFYWKLDRADPNINTSVRVENVTIGENFVTFYNEHGNKRTVTKEVVDEYTIRYTSDIPYPLLINHMSHPHSTEYRIQPMHFLKQFHPAVVGEEKASQLAQKAGVDTWYQLYQLFGNDQGQQSTVQVLGNFPPTLSSYVLVDKTQSRMVFERNPFYYKVDTTGRQLPYIDRIIVEYVAQRELINGKIISGEADFEGFMTLTTDLPLYKRYEQPGNYRADLWNFAANASVFHPNYCYTDPVVRNLFRNKKFRVALSHAIDRERINQDVLFGQADPVRLSVLSNTKWFKPEYETTHGAYDPAMANALLDEIGVIDVNGDGWREGPDGNEVHWDIEYVVSEAPRGPIAEIVNENWRSVGLNVDVQLREATLGFARSETNEMAMWIWHGDARTEVLFPARVNSHMFPTLGQCWLDYFLSEGAAGEKPPEEVEQIYEAFVNMGRATSEEESIKWGRVMLDSAAENVWTIGTVNDFPHPMIVKNDLKNFPTPDDGPLYYIWSTWWTNAYEPAQFYFEDGPAVMYEESGLPEIYPVDGRQPPIERAIERGWL